VLVTGQLKAQFTSPPGKITPSVASVPAGVEVGWAAHPPGPAERALPVQRGPPFPPGTYRIAMNRTPPASPAS
jgi:hypothetical protein